MLSAMPYLPRPQAYALAPCAGHVAPAPTDAGRPYRTHMLLQAYASQPLITTIFSLT